MEEGYRIKIKKSKNYLQNACNLILNRIGNVENDTKMVKNSLSLKQKNSLNVRSILYFVCAINFILKIIYINFKCIYVISITIVCDKILLKLLFLNNVINFNINKILINIIKWL